MSLYFRDYFEAVYDGRIVACDKLKRVSQRLLEAQLKPGKYHFNGELAAAPWQFIERFCCKPAGRLGEPIKLEPFQKARIEAIFGFVNDDDLRQFREVMIVEGRKNGKTTETAAIELYMLLCDGEGAPEIYNVATKLDQAKKAFTACHNMVRQSPELQKLIRKRAADLYCAGNLGFIKALSSNSNGLDGLDMHMGVVDELAAIRNRDIYDLVKQSGSAREQSLMFTISTNGFVRENIFDQQYEYARKWIYGEQEDEHFLALIYELDKAEEWVDESCWIKANPGIGTIKKLETLREYVNKAMGDPAFKPTVLVKDFNIPQTSVTAWLSYKELDNNETFDIRSFGYGVGGFDAADSIDLNAAKVLFMRPGDDRIYVKSMYWIPEAVLEEERKRGDRKGRDSVPYEIWIQRGLMRTCPGRKCGKEIFLDWFRELRDEYDIYTLYIGYDPWHIDDTLLSQFKTEFGQNCMIPVRQGVYTLSQPMKDLKADFQEHRIIYGDNPIDKWCLINTEIKTDINGNIQPVKGINRYRRIDGTIALLCGYKVLMDKKDAFIYLNDEEQ